MASKIRTFADACYQLGAVFPYNALTVPRFADKLVDGSLAADSTGDGTDLSPVSPTSPPEAADSASSSGSRNKIRNNNNRSLPSTLDIPTTIDPELIELCTSDQSVSSLVAKDPTLAPGDAWARLYGDRVQKIRHRRAGSGAAGGTGSTVRGEKGPVNSDYEQLARAAKCGRWGAAKPSELFLRIYHDALCALGEDLHTGVVSPSLMGSCGTVPLTIISTIPDICRHMSNLIVRAERDVFLLTNYWASGVATRIVVDALHELNRRCAAESPARRVVVKVLYDLGSAKQLFDPHCLVPESEFASQKVALPRREEVPNLDLEVMNYHVPLLGTMHFKGMVVDRQTALLQSNNLQDNDNVEMAVQLEGSIVDSVYDAALITWNRCMEPPMPSRGPAAAAADHASVSGENGGGSFGVESHGALFDKDGKLRQDFEAVMMNNPGQDTASLPKHNPSDAHYDADIAGEVLRVQASVTGRTEASGAAETRMQAVTRHLNHTTNPKLTGDAPECAAAEAMTPYVPLPRHAPVPMALVNRPPYGPPNHKSVANPQNAAWLAALRHARRSVFIQSPTLNAELLVPAIAEAVNRGVDVYCYVCLGYNDTGELLPLQGGHNELIAHRLFALLAPAARAHLHYYWYVAKDQTRPLTQHLKQRSCHVKLMIVDEAVAIQGSGNQDTQSWYHSQEVNVVIDSPLVCRAWIDALRRNQNTHIYGALSQHDGLWTDAHGNQAQGAMGPEVPRFSWAKGLVGAVRRVQGTGGF